MIHKSVFRLRDEYWTLVTSTKRYGAAIIMQCHFTPSKKLDDMSPAKPLEQECRMSSLTKWHLGVCFRGMAWIVCMITSGSLAHASSSDVVLYASKAPVKTGTWAVVADSSAAGGYAIGNPNLGAAKLTSPLAQPANYFELTFPASSGQAYHLWIRARSLDNATSNDSVYVQFSDSVNSSKTAIYRIGTTSAAPVVLQACSGATIQGWGWTDNGWCGLGSAIYFQSTGTHTIRVQVREDGLSIDQIVL